MRKWSHSTQESIPWSHIIGQSKKIHPPQSIQALLLSHYNSSLYITSINIYRTYIST